MVSRSVFVFFVSLFFAVVLSAQSLSFPTTDAEWVYFCDHDNESEPPTQYVQTLLGDTLYNGLTYQKVSASRTDATDAGLLRVEGDAVYFVPQDSVQEYLLYDFSLAVGDTFPLAPYWQFQPGYAYIWVDQIDSIVTSDGITRRRYFFQPFQNVWLEGVGALEESLTRPGYTFFAGHPCPLNCYTQGGVQTYKRVLEYLGDLYTCNGVISSVRPSPNEWELTVFPNPVTETLYIEPAPPGAITRLTLYDARGQAVLSATYTNRLDIPDQVAAGLYSLHIVTDAGAGVRRVVIQ